MVDPVQAGIVPWPQDFVERYVEHGYWLGKTLHEHFDEVVEHRGDHLAVQDGEVKLTYNELQRRSIVGADRLLQTGLQPGDRIIVQLLNGWEFVVLTLACLRSGVIPVMALPAHRNAEIRYLADHAQARALVIPPASEHFDHPAMARSIAADSDFVEQVLVAGADQPGCTGLDDLLALDPSRDAVPHLTANERVASSNSRSVALFLLSGGTTGVPKLITRTHDDYLYNALASAEVSGFDEQTVYLVTLPASHNFPLACPGLLGALFCGGTVVLLSSPEPERALRTIETSSVTHTAMVPAVAGSWLDAMVAHIEAGTAPDVGSLKVVQVGGSRLADEQARRVAPVLGATLQQVFGMAEGLLNYTGLSDDNEIICTTQGRPLSPGDEIRIVDDEGNDVPDGEAGALLTRGPYTPRGYYRAEDHNARCFTADGWFRTGDVCSLTTDGSLIVEGRDKDMINRGGEKVSAEEVENCLYEMGVFSLCAAIAMSDHVLGERVCVYGVLRPGALADLETVRAHMGNAGLARYKFPERLELISQIPTTKVGKVDKKELRSRIDALLSE